MDLTAMNYNPFATVNDGSCLYDCSVFAITLNSTGNVTGCVGGNDGYVAASINLCGSVTWLDNGSTVANRSNMPAGTYTLAAMSCDSSCYDTLTVIITEPSAISLSTTVVDESASGAMDGQVDLSVSGGTQCATDIQLGTGTNVSGAYALSGAIFYTWYMDQKHDMLSHSYDTYTKYKILHHLEHTLLKHLYLYQAVYQ
jgi:hypothetical protein